MSRALSKDTKAREASEALRPDSLGSGRPCWAEARRATGGAGGEREQGVVDQLREGARCCQPRDRLGVFVTWSRVAFPLCFLPWRALVAGAEIGQGETGLREQAFSHKDSGAGVAEG